MFFNFHTHFSSVSPHEILNLGNPIQETKAVFSIGCHPKDTFRYKDFSMRLSESNCVAIGEIGLDKTLEISIADQVPVFENQILLSEKHQLPVILHCVKSWNETLTIRRKMKPKQTWVFHGFRKAALLESVLNEGLLIGIGTAILFDEKLQETLLKIPLNRILIETDTDEKHTIEEVYQQISKIKNIPLPDLKEQVFQTIKQTFTTWEIGSNEVNY